MNPSMKAKPSDLDADAKDSGMAGEAYHGGLHADELQRYGICLRDAIDFSSNILAHGPSPYVRMAVRDANLAAYPDRDCVELRKLLSDFFHIDPQQILVGSGSCELIHLIASTLIQPSDSVLIVGPTFSEYKRASQLASANVIECVANASDKFVVPVDKIESILELAAVTVVWLCNPNNPSGSSVSEQQILQWVHDYPGTIFVIDESYIEFAEQTRSLIAHKEPNLIVLRSMTKSFGIAGLRLGFAVASSEMILRLCRRRVPWTVSAPAQAAGIAAIQDNSFYRNAISETMAAKRDFLIEMRSRGFDPNPTDANYFLLPLADAQQVRFALISEGLVVRDCTSFGLPNYVRIAVRQPIDNLRLINKLSEVTATSLSESTAFAVGKSSDNGIDERADVSTDDNVRSPERLTPWNAAFREQLGELFRLRRDVRRFKTDAIPADAIQRWIEAACLAPSVGLSQPWKFVSVNDASRRSQMIQEFESQNQIAGDQYALAAKYRELKLAGLKEAPEHLAVFVDPEPTQGRGLGRRTMPESVAYSVVAAIQNFWLAARTEGVGVGWVSILRPEAVNGILEVPNHWQLIAYLCVGYPVHADVETPELETYGWENRGKLEEQWFQR